MNRMLLSGIAFALLTMAVAAARFGDTTAQQTLPTPKGQFGGPVPLTQPAGMPAQPSPTPIATSTSEPEGTPAATALDTPHPDECRIAPRRLDDILVLVATPAPPADEAIASPDGESGSALTDPEAVAGVTMTIRELLACGNAGDGLRGFALFTDRYLRQVLLEGELQPGNFAEHLGAPQPLPQEEWAALGAIRDLRIYADGRVSADVTIVEPDAVSSAVFVFIEAGDRWLIDGIVVLGIVGTPTP